MDKKTWKEFRETGLLWLVNTILHVFGWAIVVYDDPKDESYVATAYPARVKFRGFETGSNDRGYLRVTKYMAEHSTELLHDITNGDENDITGGVNND